MARMPGAIWRPLAANYDDMPRVTAWDIFCLHTMVGSLTGTDGYFRVGNGAGYGGTESHFGVGHDGTIYQWQDTAYQADANWRGGWHIISSENADTGTGFPKWGGSDVPAFTPAQIEANAKIALWLHKQHGIPLDIIPDAKPGRRGIGWHRQGVPGYAVAGAEMWSKATGKVCPGDRRVAQVPLISARAKQLLNPPKPAPGGIFMALSDAEQRELLNAVRELTALRKSEATPDTTFRGKVGDYVVNIDAATWQTKRDVEAALAELAKLAAAVEALGEADPAA
jgi:hypothetical protein